MQGQLSILLIGAVIGFISAISLEFVRHTLERYRAKREREINLLDTKRKDIKGFLNEDRDLAWLRLIQTNRTSIFAKMFSQYREESNENIGTAPKTRQKSPRDRRDITIRKYVLSQTQVIGRQADCEIRLTDRYISRIHAMIRFENGVFVVYDLGSTTGTFVNSKEVGVARVELNYGDSIRVGESMFVFEEVIDGGLRMRYRRKSRTDVISNANTQSLNKKKQQKSRKKNNLAK